MSLTFNESSLIYLLEIVFSIAYCHTFLGFICPVHTPDGAPCGLLNHLTMNCIVTKHPDKKLRAAIPLVLLDLGMSPLDVSENIKDCYIVILDGKVIGRLQSNIAEKVVNRLRILKIDGDKVNCSLIFLLIGCMINSCKGFDKNFFFHEIKYRKKYSMCWHILIFTGTFNYGNSFSSKEKWAVPVSGIIFIHWTSAYDETCNESTC